MNKVIGIQTTRYSEVMTRILAAYGKDAEIRIKRSHRSRPEVVRGIDADRLLEDWCTNARIRQTVDFSLTQGETCLFAFHDHPDNMWADISTLPFVEELADAKVLRYEVTEWRERTPLLTHLKRLVSRSNAPEA